MGAFDAASLHSNHIDITEDAHKYAHNCPDALRNSLMIGALQHAEGRLECWRQVAPRSFGGSSKTDG